MDIWDVARVLRVFNPKAARRARALLWLAALTVPGFGTWMIGHALAHRQALLMSGANVAGAYWTSGLVRSMDTLKIVGPPPAPAATAPVADDPRRPLVLACPTRGVR